MKNTLLILGSVAVLGMIAAFQVSPRFFASKRGRHVGIARGGRERRRTIAGDPEGQRDLLRELSLHGEKGAVQ